MTAEEYLRERYDDCKHKTGTLILMSEIREYGDKRVKESELLKAARHVRDFLNRVIAKAEDSDE